MLSATYAVTIRRPVGAVFAFVSDGENDPMWRPAVVDIRRVSGEDAGARYAQRVRGPMGRPVAADYEVTVVEPNRRLEFQTIAGPVRLYGRYDFAPDEGGTELTLALNAKLTGIARLVLPRAVQRSMDAEVRNLDNLKRILESS